MWLESHIDLDLLPDTFLYDQLEHRILQIYLGPKAERARKVISKDQLTKLVDNELEMDMKNLSTGSCIETLFVFYQSFLYCHELCWIPIDKRKALV